MKAKKIIRVLVVSFFLLSGCLKEKGIDKDFKRSFLSENKYSQFSCKNIDKSYFNSLISKTSSKFEENCVDKGYYFIKELGSIYFTKNLAGDMEILVKGKNDSMSIKYINQLTDVLNRAKIFEECDSIKLVFTIPEFSPVVPSSYLVK